MFFGRSPPPIYFVFHQPSLVELVITFRKKKYIFTEKPLQIINFHYQITKYQDIGTGCRVSSNQVILSCKRCRLWVTSGGATGQEIVLWCCKLNLLKNHPRFGYYH